MFRKLLNCELDRPTLEEYRTLEKAPIAIVIDNIRSQHNIGSAFRTGDAFKICKIYICGISATPPSPEIHKSALGAEFSVEWKYFSQTQEAISSLKQEGYEIISVEQTENSTSLDEFQPDISKKYALVFGNEVKGIQQDVVDMSNLCIEIPQHGTKHSLNVSVAIGIVLWHLRNFSR